MGYGSYVASFFSLHLKGGHIIVVSHYWLRQVEQTIPFAGNSCRFKLGPTFLIRKGE